MGESIEDAKSVLNNRPNWSLNFTHKAGNFAAHALTKLGLNFLIEQIWIEEIHHDIVQAIMNDMLSSMKFPFPIKIYIYIFTVIEA